MRKVSQGKKIPQYSSLSQSVHKTGVYEMPQKLVADLKDSMNKISHKIIRPRALRSLDKGIYEIGLQKAMLEICAYI